MPTTLEQLRTFIAAARRTAKSGFQLVDQETEDHRTVACDGCPNRDGFRCGLCGCLLVLKIPLATEQCPHPKDRWDRSHLQGFFSLTERQVALELELESWRGTPFWKLAHGQAQKGAKADCVSFVSAVLVNLGAIQPFEWPSYVTLGGGPEMLQNALATISRIPQMVQLWGPGREIPELLPGDLLVGIQRGHPHVGLAGTGVSLWHCTMQHGVTCRNSRDPIFRENLQAIFRVQ